MEQPPDQDERPAIKALIAQLASDTGDFARAEAVWLREQAGERWSYALPALAMLGAGTALLIAVVIALPLGLMIALAPYAGGFGAVGLVIAAFLLIGACLLRMGSRRIKAALKPPEDR